MMGKKPLASSPGVAIPEVELGSLPGRRSKGSRVKPTAAVTGNATAARNDPQVTIAATASRRECDGLKEFWESTGPDELGGAESHPAASDAANDLLAIRYCRSVGFQVGGKGSQKAHITVNM